MSDEETQKNGGDKCARSNPPHWIPIPNDKSLYISSRDGVCSFENGLYPCACTGMIVGKCCNKPQTRGKSFFVSIHDRNQIEPITYNTKVIEIDGVDIRVYGNQIEYDSSSIRVEQISDDGTDTKRLLIKGGRISVKDVRAVNIEKVEIIFDEKIDIQLHTKRETAERSNGGVKLPVGLGYFLSFIGYICCLIFLSFMPFVEFDAICKKYSTALCDVSKANKVTAAWCSSEPPAVTNALSVLTSCSGVADQSLPTNVVKATTSVSSVVGSQVQLKENEGSGTLGVTFCLALICLLYGGLYGVFIYLTLTAFHAWRRHWKLNDGIGSVLNALREETDKKKRQEMRDKILGGMIDTYLDRPSSDE